MATQMGISCYSVPPRTKEDIARDNLRYFKWMKARIEAESLNPEPDYEGERARELIKEIATSNLDVAERKVLMDLLESEETEEGDTYD